MWLTAIMLASLVPALVVAPRLGAADRPPKAGRNVGHPGMSLLAVVAVVYINQVLLNVYMLRVHGGDPSFIARYLPSGWFDLASRNPAIVWLAGVFPDPKLLGFTVLRVQSFLELPFGVFAYLTICYWFGPWLYTRAVRLVWPAAASFTVVFCLIEWQLHNPFTVQDIVIRVASGLVVPLWASRFRAPTATGGLLLFAISTGALSYLILVVYDSALLYNLGRLGGEIPGAILAVVVLAGARLLARRLPEPSPGTGAATISSAFGWFLLLFFVPALPVRYGLIEGEPFVAAICGVALVTTSAVLGARDALRAAPLAPRTWVAEMFAAVALGTATALAARLLPGGHTETHILWMGAAFFLTATLACMTIDTHRRQF